MVIDLIVIFFNFKEIMYFLLFLKLERLFIGMIIVVGNLFIFIMMLSFLVGLKGLGNNFVGIISRLVWYFLLGLFKR